MSLRDAIVFALYCASSTGVVVSLWSDERLAAWTTAGWAISYAVWFIATAIEREAVRKAERERLLTDQNDARMPAGRREG